MLLLLTILLMNGSGTDGSSNHLASIGILSEKTNFESSGKVVNAEWTGQTLEQCYGGIGRWLSSTSEKKKELTRKLRCCDVCCERLTPGSQFKSQRNGKESSKCCFQDEFIDCDVSSNDQGQGTRKCYCHVKAIRRDGCSNIDCSKEARSFPGGEAVDSELSSFRLASIEPRATLGHALDTGHDAVSSSLQCSEGEKLKILKGSRRKSSSDGDNHRCISTICCDLCNYRSVHLCSVYTLAAVFWCPVYLIHRGCRSFGGLCSKGLGNCLLCCCGKPK